MLWLPELCQYMDQGMLFTGWRKITLPALTPWFCINMKTISVQLSVTTAATRKPLRQVFVIKAVCSGKLSHVNTSCLNNIQWEDKQCMVLMGFLCFVWTVASIQCMQWSPGVFYYCELRKPQRSLDQSLAVAFDKNTKTQWWKGKRRLDVCLHSGIVTYASGGCVCVYIFNICLL